MQSNKSVFLRQASQIYNMLLGTLSRKNRNQNMNEVGQETDLIDAEDEPFIRTADWRFPLTTNDMHEAVFLYLENCGKNDNRLKLQIKPCGIGVYNLRTKHSELTNHFGEKIKGNRDAVSLGIKVFQYDQNMKVVNTFTNKTIKKYFVLHGNVITL
ncbi:hypothetical protein HHI36_008964 [Cryptolaemus montrouzieri]|uniref:Uncharacterized protein n=1 Tax=Cryptolaemus montrouzieri TaxID=559131 RepID=A0ABD2MUJ1_9CUCU